MAHLTPAQRQAVSSRTPFLFSPSSNEAYLPCIPPTASTSAFLSSLRLTPPRLSDVSLLVSTLNDPTVFPQMRSIPYPLPEAGGRAMIESNLKASEDLLEQWAEGEAMAEGCPFNAIRAMVGGEEVWVGGIGVRRWPFDELDGKEKEEAVKDMLGKPLGDPTILRTLGFYLRPAYQGKGIMSIVLSTLLNAYLVPLCGARLLRSTVYNGNFGSRRVFEKCGFTSSRTNWINAGASRGGMMKEEWWMEWKWQPKSPAQDIETLSNVP